MSGWKAGVTVARSLPRRYVFGGSLWALHHCIPLLAGLALKAVFDRVNDGPAAAADALPLLAVVVAVEAFRSFEFWVAMLVWPRWWHASMAVIRQNMLGSLLRDRTPPSLRLPGSAGEAQARFRDDVEDVVWFVDLWVDVVGASIYTVIAIVIMARIDPLVAFSVAIPMAATFGAIRAIGDRIQSSHGATRQAGSSVTALIGDIVANALALKAAGAERDVMDRLRATNVVRRDNAVRAGVLVRLMDVTSGVAAEVAVGLTLLAAAGAMRRGDFTVGDLSLFTTYAAGLTWGPRWLGRLLARKRHVDAVLPRLALLLEEPEVADVVALAPVYVHEDPPAPVSSGSVPRLDGDGLQRLDVVGLTSRHRTSRGGVFDVTFSVERGSFTVITGAVGSGKSTLVRAVLGLLPIDGGHVAWNGQVVEDRHSFFVPPRTAYAGQVPRLFSATLEENLLLGWPAGEEDVAAALRLAALDDDVAEFGDGLQTMVGARGVRLSGGQLQRATAARAFVRGADLVVVDDLSSALDVETEERLWERLAGVAGQTSLVVSHRRSAIERADQVVVLDGGRVAGAGSLRHLLRTTPEMRRLWVEELVVEGEEAIGAG